MFNTKSVLFITFSLGTSSSTSDSSTATVDAVTSADDVEQRQKQAPEVCQDASKRKSKVKFQQFRLTGLLKNNEHAPFS